MGGAGSRGRDKAGGGRIPLKTDRVALVRAPAVAVTVWSSPHCVALVFLLLLFLSFFFRPSMCARNKLE